MGQAVNDFKTFHDEHLDPLHIVKLNGAPDLPPLPPAPPPPVDVADKITQDAASAERRKQMAATGYQATFLTGPKGVAPLSTASYPSLSGK